MSVRREIRAGRAFVELGLRSKLDAGLKRAEDRLRRFGTGLQAIGTRLFGLGTAITAPLLGAVQQFMTAGDAMDKLAARSRAPVEQLSAMGFAAGQAGSNVETLAGAMERGGRRIARAAQDASGPAAAALDDIGLSAASLADMTPDEQFLTIADRLAGMADQALAAQHAYQIFGGEARQLWPLMAQGRAEIERQMQVARQLGLVWDTEAAASAAKLSDAIGVLWQQVKRVGIEIGDSLVDDVLAATHMASGLLTNVIDLVKANGDLFVIALRVGAALMAAGAAFIAAGTAMLGMLWVATQFATLGSIIVGSIVGFAKLAVAMAAPLAIATALGTAAFFALRNWSEFTDKARIGAQNLAGSAIAASKTIFGALTGAFAGVAANANKAFSGIGAALTAGNLELALRIAGAGLQAAWLDTQQGIRQLWQDHLSDLFGDFSTTIEAITTLMMAGELEQAWQHAVDAMEVIWDEAMDKMKDKFIEMIKHNLDMGRRLTELTDPLAEAALDVLGFGRSEPESSPWLGPDGKPLTLSNLERLKNEANRILDELGDGKGPDFDTRRQNINEFLDELVAEAKRQAEKREPIELDFEFEFKAVDFDPEEFGFDPEDLDVTMERAAGTQNLATFSAEMAQRFAAGVHVDRTAERIARGVETLDENDQEVIRLLQDGIRFT